MIAKSRKFPMRTDFYGFKKQAMSIRLREFAIYFKSSKEPKVGIVISKKSLSQAVDRNKLKRQIFPLVYETAYQKKIDIIVILGRFGGVSELVPLILQKLEAI